MIGLHRLVVGLLALGAIFGVYGWRDLAMLMLLAGVGLFLWRASE